MKLGIFSGEQARRLAKISVTQLRYWSDTDVIRPETVEGSGPFRHVYTFRDVVGLRTLSILRNEHGVELEALREVARRLRSTPDASWANTVFYLGDDGLIYFDDPTTTARVSVQKIGQVSLFRVDAVIRSVEQQLRLLNRRTAKQIGKVEQSRYILRNKPVIAGTRVPVSAIVDLHEGGFTVEQIIKEYPRLKSEDVKAALTYNRISVAS